MATFFFIGGVIICAFVLFGLFFALTYALDRSGTWRRSDAGGASDSASGSDSGSGDSVG